MPALATLRMSITTSMKTLSQSKTFAARSTMAYLRNNLHSP
jgi:hypothetical protein